MDDYNRDLLDPYVTGTVLVAVIAIFIFGIVLKRAKTNKLIQNKLKKSKKNQLWINTPLIKSEWLSSYINDDDDSKTEVYLKLDALQPSGSFKIRGLSTFCIKQLELNPFITTLVSTSSANAGMAVAYVAYKLNKQCLIILDKPNKNNALIAKMEFYGAKIEFYGSNWNEADEYAKKSVLNNKNYLYVPMFDHPFIFNGHSTIISEIANNCVDLDIDYPDCIVVSVGGGGLLCGVLTGLFRVGWVQNCDIYATQTENCELFGKGVKNNYTPIPVRITSAEGFDLGDRQICQKAMEFAKKFKQIGNPIVSITTKDKDVLDMCTMFALRHHILIEPLCAVALAGLYANKNMFKQYNNIVVIVCGGDHFYYNGKQLEKEDILPETFKKH